MMKSWLGFGDLDLIFKATAGLKLPNLSQKMIVCTISPELVSRFQPDLLGYNIGTWWRADLVLVTLTYFSRSLRDLNCQIWAKRCLWADYVPHWRGGGHIVFSVDPQAHAYFHVLIMFLTKGEGDILFFGADPVGVGIGMTLSCMLDIS